MPFYKSIESKEQKERAEEAIELKIKEKLKTGNCRPPKYTYENALKRMLKASEILHGYESITKEDAKILCERGLRKMSETQWKFSRDFRIDVLPLQGTVGQKNEKRPGQKNSWNQINQFHGIFFGPNSIFFAIFELGKSLKLPKM